MLEGSEADSHQLDHSFLLLTHLVTLLLSLHKQLIVALFKPSELILLHPESNREADPNQYVQEEEAADEILNLVACAVKDRVGVIKKPLIIVLIELLQQPTAIIAIATDTTCADANISET